MDYPTPPELGRSQFMVGNNLAYSKVFRRDHHKFVRIEPAPFEKIFSKRFGTFSVRDVLERFALRNVFHVGKT
jgi:hypothetical protein